MVMTNSVCIEMSLQVLSPEPVTSYLPFALNLQLKMASLWPSIEDVHLVAGCTRKVDSGTQSKLIVSSVESSFSFLMHSLISLFSRTSMRQLVLSFELLLDGVSSVFDSN